jgi:MbtH protein
VNPFDDESARFKVLTNGEGQHSLWPSEIAVPPGWAVRLDDASRDACLAYVESHWDDMRPRSLQ